MPTGYPKNKKKARAAHRAANARKLEESESQRMIHDFSAAQVGAVPIPPPPPPADDVFAKLRDLNRAIEVAWLNGYHPCVACVGAEVVGTDARPPTIEVQLSMGQGYPPSRQLRFFGKS